MEITNETPAKKTKRLTSVVWNHFERIRKGDICYAVCVHCKKKLSGSSNSGTTHLRNHLLRCLKRSNCDVSQILAAKRKKKDTSVSLTNLTYEEGIRKDEIVSPITYRTDQEPKKEEINQPINLGSVRFDQERSRLDLARMIMLHGYPLTMVEHVGFNIFAKNLQPLFEVSSNNAIELDCMTIYCKEKQKIYETIHSLHSRISVAADMWFSSENARYLCLTAYYVDGDWKLQKRMLNFVTLDPFQTDDLLSDVVIKCLTDWAIERKLFSMTFDDLSDYDDMVFRIKDWLSQSKPLKNSELFDVRSAAYFLRSIVQDVMEALRDVIDKIRESLRHVRRSQTTLGKFNEIAQQVGINGERHLLLDCPMQWNSIYSMLEAAVENRGAFSLLQEHDPSYTMALSETEWEWATAATSYMKLFVEVTNDFTANKYPTANIYFPLLCDVHIQLTEWCKSSDDVLSSVAMKMKAKFDKYWKKCSLAVAIATILDPRFKMKVVEYYYPQIYDKDAPEHIKEVCDGIRELFNEYAISSSSVDQDSSLPDGCLPSTSSGSRDRLRGFDKFLHETSQIQSTASDLDKYLEEPVFPRNYDFNILNWWKVHTPRYPILSMMARDVLAIPISTLGRDLVFNNRGRMLECDRSSLSPDAREALMCGQDWLRAEPEETKPSMCGSALSVFVEKT